jgi:hypothetical protein
MHGRKDNISGSVTCKRKYKVKERKVYMGIWDDDYDRTFDMDRDGKLDRGERFLKMEFETSIFDKKEDPFEEDQEDILSVAGLDQSDLEFMDDDERREALEDAGLDSDDFDF